MIINVTAEDIVEGHQGGSCNCPIALATKRAASDYYVSVGLSVLIVKGRTFDLPHAARHFIKQFDAGYVVEPFSFVTVE